MFILPIKYFVTKISNSVVDAFEMDEDEQNFLNSNKSRQHFQETPSQSFDDDSKCILHTCSERLLDLFYYRFIDVKRYVFTSLL